MPRHPSAQLLGIIVDGHRMVHPHLPTRVGYLTVVQSGESRPRSRSDSGNLDSQVLRRRCVGSGQRRRPLGLQPSPSANPRSAIRTARVPIAVLARLQTTHRANGIPRNPGLHSTGSAPMPRAVPAGIHRRNQPQPKAGEMRREHWDWYHHRAEAALTGILSHNVSIGDSVRASDLEDAVLLLLQIQCGQQVFEHIFDGDWLRGGGHPFWANHYGKPLHQGPDQLEGEAGCRECR